MTIALPSSKECVEIISAYAVNFPYVVCHDVKEIGASFGLIQLYRQRPLQSNWYVGELMAFEGVDFAEAATQFLRSRASTATERAQFETDRRAYSKLSFLLDLDDDNRKEGSPVRLLNVRMGRAIWRSRRFFEKNRIKPMQKLSGSLFRKYARRMVSRLLPETSLRQIVHLSLIRIQFLTTGPSER